MKACWFEAFGAAQDVLQQGDRATPEPGPDEVLVQLGVRHRVQSLCRLFGAHGRVPRQLGA